MTKAGFLTVAFVFASYVRVVAADDKSPIDDLESRISLYKLNEFDALRRMQVSVLMTESGEHLHFDKQNQSTKVDLVLEVFYRLAILDQGVVRRVDGTRLEMSNGSELHPLREHFFLSSTDATHVAGLPLKCSFKKAERKSAKHFPQMIYTGVMSPFEYAWCSYFGVQNHASALERMIDLKVLNSKKNEKDEMEFFVLAPSNRAAYQITFDSKVDWLPRKVTFYMRVDKENAALSPSELSMDLIVSSWSQRGVTETEWQEFDGKDISVHVPVRISIVHSGPRDNVVRNLTFKNWKFGDDVHDSAVTEAGFTKDSVLSFDYDRLRSEFKESPGPLTIETRAK